MPPAPAPTISSARRGVLLVASAALCWSSGGLITRLVTTDPWTTSFWRSLFASIALILVLSIRSGPGALAGLHGPAMAAAACMALSSTCFILALSRTSVADTLILMATGPYVAGLLGWLLLGERVAVHTWLAMGVAMAGAVVMVSSSYAQGAILGDLLAMVMAASFAVATVLVRRHPHVPMAPAAVLATVLTWLVALPFASPVTTAPRNLLLLALFGVGQFAGGFLLFMAGARLLPAAQTSLIGMLETVLGPLWVWLVLSERPGAATLLGGALILSALLVNGVIELMRSPRAAPSEPA